MIKIVEHEEKVEKFYTTGSKVNLADFDSTELRIDNEGFLSFGYWENKTDRYLDATKRLLKFVIENSEVKDADRILNVACGFGPESFAYFEHFKPNELIGIDIAKVHTDYANLKAKQLGVADKVKFVHGDAVALDFPDRSFSHILGIEGPAHFNTREKFFKSAGRVLKQGGELLLTDVILGEKFKAWNPLHQTVLRVGAKGWVVPMANGVKEAAYKKQLEDAGFEIVFLKKIGDKVFPGYSRSFDSEVIQKHTKCMGFMTSMGFTFIGKLLGWLYKKGFIEYVYVKARKK
ncbi:MAG: class I SAM-dependent methyltransferase [Candidatus Nanoarchaeia archaeon]|nr:class I SAM-dependent methyltransferase [Candidatus Nanoarchaeia archaeon]MDD5239035.1 class I SAM-dependent methyltransferase [Candidatus Nanoarchaeia archaeon]